jgi:hypothetical protein
MKALVFKNGELVDEVDGPELPAPAPLALTFRQFVALAMQAGGMTPLAYAAARSNPALMVFFDLLMQAQGIQKSDPDMSMGGAAFVSEGMLTQEGWDAMLANWPMA